MSKLTLTLLGPPRVLHNGRLLKFRSRKELGLLLYLAAEGGSHDREKLAGLFWPKSGEKAGRAALRNALAGLQKTLKDSAETPEDTHLIATRDSICFDFASDFDLDLRILEAASSRTDEERREMVAGLRAAVKAYGGDFLEGFHLDDAPDLGYWLEVERGAWRGRVGEAHDRLSRLQMESGETPAAIETAAGWVARDPFDEAASRRLMEARLASGDRDGAMRDYERYRLLLEKKLGAEPGPEMSALAIRAGTDAS
ncbi:MAG: AfsR/SARP family transcriptional regulator, partial [Rubrobacteraceae bacterium]